MALIQDVTRSGSSNISVKIPAAFSLPANIVQAEPQTESIKKTVPPLNTQRPVFLPASPSFGKTVNKTASKPWMPFSTPAATFQNRPTVSATEKAIEQLEVSYERLLQSINLKLFRPEKINQYIATAEKRSGTSFSEEEKQQIRLIAQSGDENSTRLLALELRVGIPKKSEREALAALGELMLHRHNTKVLEQFVEDPHNDENLKAHIKTILMVNKVESAMLKMDNIKRDLSNLTRGLTSMFGS